jgi:hypothetical protein
VQPTDKCPNLPSSGIERRAGLGSGRGATKKLLRFLGRCKPLFLQAVFAQPVQSVLDRLFGFEVLPGMQTLDLPAVRVTGIVEDIGRIARKASHRATRKLPKFVVARFGGMVAACLVVMLILALGPVLFL